MSCWTGLNVFDYVRLYGNPFQQTDNHVELYQKLCARVNSRFAIWDSKNWNLKFHFTAVKIYRNRKAVKFYVEFYDFLCIIKVIEAM